MCGICAILYKDKNCFDFLYDGLQIIMNRGYDSMGICTLSKDLNISKFSNKDNDALIKIKNNKNIHDNTNIGIAHTRWATHGSPSDINAHPHIDLKNKISIVHNGIIFNYKELRKNLISNNYIFKSDTDTEVIVNLISYYLDIYNDINKAIKTCVSQLIGTWGIVILYKYTPNTLYISRCGSPLVAGYNDECLMIASEKSVFINTNQFIEIPDNSIYTFELNNNNFTNITKIFKSEKIYEIHNYDKPTLQNFKHYTIKEIYEQPESIIRVLNNGARIHNSNIILGGLNNHKKQLLNIEHIILLGSGTSFNAGLLGSKYLKSLKCFKTVHIYDSASFTFDDIPNVNMDNIGLILLSQSGETRDLLNVIDNNPNLFKCGIINTVGSSIARMTDCGVYLNAGIEVGVASTKSFTSQVICLMLIGLWYNQQHNINITIRHHIIDELGVLSNECNKCIKLCHDTCKYISKLLINTNRAFILARNFDEPICYEGALKIKELTYLHIEGFQSSALKHGHFTLITDDTIIFYICTDKKDIHKINNTAEQTKARKSINILITSINFEINNDIYDHIIRINYLKYFGSLLAVIPFQLIAYELGLLKNILVDQPRHLAKSVTVE